MVIKSENSFMGNVRDLFAAVEIIFLLLLRKISLTEGLIVN